MELFYLFGFFYLLNRIYQVLKRIHQVSNGMQLETVINARQEAQADPIGTWHKLWHGDRIGIIIFALNTLWVFLGFYSPEKLLFFVMAIHTGGWIFTRFTALDTGRELFFYCWNMFFRIGITSLLLYRHFVA